MNKGIFGVPDGENLDFGHSKRFRGAALGYSPGDKLHIIASNITGDCRGERRAKRDVSFIENMPKKAFFVPRLPRRPFSSIHGP